MRKRGARGNQTLCGYLALKRSVGLLDEKHLTKISVFVEIELAVDVNCFVDLADRGQIDQGCWEGESIKLKMCPALLMDIFISALSEQERDGPCRLMVRLAQLRTDQCFSQSRGIGGIRRRTYSSESYLGCEQATTIQRDSLVFSVLRGTRSAIGRGKNTRFSQNEKKANR